MDNNDKATQQVLPIEQSQNNPFAPQTLQILNEVEEAITPIPEGNDDGSLAFLQIPSDASRRQFNCPEVTQQKLVNTTFWLIDFYDNIKTKYGMRMLIKIKSDPKASETDARKFFTNCEDTKYVLREIRKRNAFPRRVTLRANGNHYFFE